MNKRTTPVGGVIWRLVMGGLTATAAITACATATEEPNIGTDGDPSSTDLGSSSTDGGGGATSATFTSNVVSATVAGPGSNANTTSDDSTSTESSTSTGSNDTSDTSGTTSMGGASSTMDSTTSTTGSFGGDGGAGSATATVDTGTGGDASSTMDSGGPTTMGSMGGAASTTMNATTVTSTTGGGDTGTCTAPMVDGTFNSTFTFDTTDAICVRYSETISGWGVSNFDGRSLSVNGQSITISSNLPALPAKLNGYYYFDVSKGDFAWAAITTW